MVVDVSCGCVLNHITLEVVDGACAAAPWPAKTTFDDGHMI